MGSIANMPKTAEVEISKKTLLNFLLKELSGKIHRSIGSVGFTVALEELEGWFSLTVYDQPLELLKPTFKALREEHTLLYSRIEFEPFRFEELDTNSYIDIISFIMDEMNNILIGH